MLDVQDGQRTENVPGYRQAVHLYREAGWLGVLPLRPREKVPHLAGFTGYEGAWPTDEQIKAWSDNQAADSNLMLRLNYGLIGIDVDAHSGKTGGRTIEEAQKLWGPLPPTCRSSSRSGDLISGIRVYRVREGLLLRGEIKFDNCGHVDIVQPHHRHITAWPSIHPNGGRYQWYGPDGSLLPEGQVPRVEELPELPAEWVMQLSRDALRDEVFDGSAPNRTAAQREKINEERYNQLIQSPDNGPPDRVVAERLDRALIDLTSGTGSRYDITRDHVGALMRVHAFGRMGVPRALDQLCQAYVLEVTDTRPAPVAQAEFLRFTEGAAALVASTSQDRISMIGKPDGDKASGDLCFTDGASFILDIPDEIPALWGAGQRVLWPKGESLMICGATGLGKTTLAGELLRGQLCGTGRAFGGSGKIDDRVLDLPVAQVEGKILYLAMDRPAQIARSLHRQFSGPLRGVLEERLVIWRGPPPHDLAAKPELLVELAERAEASVVYLDSLKDAALGLSEDAVGSGYNRARQILLSRGIELVELHHVIKSTTGGIEDAFGSTWLTAGAGSVIMLTGKPGDPIVKLGHVKIPAEQVGPLTLEHDASTGTISIVSGTDLVALATDAGAEGITAKQAAAAIRGKGTPDNKEVARARRQLEKLGADGELKRIAGSRGGANGGRQDRWVIP